MWGAYTDFICQRFGATALMAAIDHQRRTGEGQHVDLSQFESAAQFLGTELLDCGDERPGGQRDGNRDPGMAPHGVYPCRPGDDGAERWVAIAVEDDERWPALRAALGGRRGPPTRSPRHVSSGRKAREEELDERAGGLDRRPDGGGGGRRASSRRSRPAPVHNQSELHSDPQILHRGYFVDLEHREQGVVPYDGMQATLSRTPAPAAQRRPLRGPGHDARPARLPRHGRRRDRGPDRGGGGRGGLTLTDVVPVSAFSAPVGSSCGCHRCIAPRLGLFPPPGYLEPEFDLRGWLDAVADAGLSHVGVGDHVSFVGGSGNDGLITATALSALRPDLPVYTGIYLLPLRHPVLVARQIATLSQLAPAGLVFGVGVGGEDRHEVEVAGVDPATRGRRMDECLEVLRGLLTGESVTFAGEFFDLDDALVLPAPEPPPPIVVGGRSDAALRRAGRLGDGWIAIWVSPRRFAEAVEVVAGHAEEAGRDEPPTRHALQLWCGFGDDDTEGLIQLAPAMEDFYDVPFDRFDRYSPRGTAEDVARFLQPYVDAGCRELTLIPRADSWERALEGAAEVRRLLAGG